MSFWREIFSLSSCWGVCFELYDLFLRVHHIFLSRILAERKENFKDSSNTLLLESNRDFFSRHRSSRQSYQSCYWILAERKENFKDGSNSLLLESDREFFYKVSQRPPELSKLLLKFKQCRRKSCLIIKAIFLKMTCVKLFSKDFSANILNGCF